MNPRVYRLPLGLILSITLMASAWARPPAEDAVILIEKTYTQTVEGLKKEQHAIAQDPAVAYRLIEQVLAPNVDFALISRLVLGRHWRTASPEQRTRFVAAFRDSLLRTYAVALSEHIALVAPLLDSDESLLKVLPLAGSAEKNRLTVRSQLALLGEGGPAVALDFQLHATPEGWKVYDVLIENISFVTNYRVEYGSLLQRTDLDTLITQLEERATRRG